jgi:hypothetical protein
MRLEMPTPSMHMSKKPDRAADAWIDSICETFRRCKQVKVLQATAAALAPPAYPNRSKGVRNEVPIDYF